MAKCEKCKNYEKEIQGCLYMDADCVNGEMFEPFTNYETKGEMMKNQLSKRESKYRCKIIAENHLNKSDQRLLDSYKKESYKNLYCDKNKLAIFISTVSVRNLSAGVCQIGNSAAEVAKAFNDMSRVLQSVYDSLGCSIIHTR